MDPHTLLAAATAQFEQAGVPTPRIDAEWLLAHVLGVRRGQLWLSADTALTATQSGAFAALVERRASREPLQYLIGTQEFYGRPFRVTPDVLIPRPETELLVDETLRNLCSDGMHILDLCTGSGCIAITLALELPNARIVATDISEAALAVARENAHAHGVADRITFRCLDVTGDQRPATSDAFDMIISNPPYCPNAEWPTLQPEVRDHEPQHAICAGEDGLAILHRIIQDAPHRLKPDGWLAVEIGDGQAEAVKRMIARQGMFSTPLTRKDYGGTERIILAQLVYPATGD